MRKKILSLFAVLIGICLIIVACSQEIELQNQNEDISKQLMMRTANEMESVPPLFTIGGSLETSPSQIQSLYELTGNNDIENLRGFIIFTTGNENGIDPINTENLKGISLFHYKNGKLEHSVYVKNIESGTYSVVPALTAYSLGETIPELDYVVYATGLYENSGLSSYSIIKNNNRSFEESYDLMEIRAITVGQIVSLENVPTTETKLLMQQLTRAQICPKYCNSQDGSVCDHNQNKCLGDRNASLEPANEGIGGTEGGGSNIDDPKICSKSKAYAKVDTSLRNNFNFPLSYEIRDDILSNSVFGMKYRSYYYDTSFYKVDIDTEDAVKIALLLPKLYSLYNNFKYSNEEELVFNEETREDITLIIESLKSKNAGNSKLNVILNDVKKDVNFLTGKNIGNLNEILY